MSFVPNGLERIAVEERNLMRIGEGDQTAALQVRQDAAYGLDRQTEVIGNIAPRHRQPNLSAGILAIGHFDQERRHPLAGRHAAEAEQMVVRCQQIPQHDFAQMPRDFRIVPDQPFGRSAREAQDRDVVDRFGREAALPEILEAERIAGEAELGDVPPSIGQEFADADGTANYPVPTPGRLAFAINLLGRRELPPTCDLFQRNQRVDLSPMPRYDHSCTVFADL
ncbi:MAG TPA: hypothetical protein VGF34_08270 [Stellaceae bacterium]